MDARERQLVVEVGGDPADEAWFWFLCRGPHGPTFTWGKSRQEPGWYVGLDHLRRVIEERTSLDADFPGRLRAIALAASNSSESEVIRRGVQVLAVVGSSEDVPFAQDLAAHPDDLVAKDARAALFELKRRARASR